MTDKIFCPQCGSDRINKNGVAGSGRQRYLCRKCKIRTTQVKTAPPQLIKKSKVGEMRKGNFYVITSAVNDTPIIAGALAAFKNLADKNAGKLLIIPTVYKNPDLVHKGLVPGLTWPAEILPYVCNINFKLNEHLMIKGETRIEHCVVNPLAGLNSAGTMLSEIYGHPQVAMEMVATPKSKLPKMLHTTGTISEKNYGGSLRAQKAKHHHSISALIVETEGKRFWTRGVHFDGVGCYDLDKYYSADKMVHSPNAAAIVYGDVHARSVEPAIDAALDVVRAKLNPQYNIFHDVHDHHIGSHHHEGDVLFYLAKEKAGELRIRDELMKSVDFLRGKANAHIVDSNHDRHLNQWFNRFKPQRDPVNCPLYFELAGLMKDSDEQNLFKLFVNQYLPDVKFIDSDTIFDVAGIDCSQHGDRGPNGARGSVKSLAKSGHKMIIGHSHTPGIEKGCYQVGVMSPNLDYAKGLSSWLNTHAIIYPNGKRALFSIIKNQLSPLMR